MKLIRKQFFILLIMVSLLGSMTVLPSSARMGLQKQKGYITIETDAITIEIRGSAESEAIGEANLATFYFWETGNKSNSYKLMMDAVFEAIDVNENGAYDLGNDTRIPNSIIPLTTRTWEFSEINFVNNTDEVVEEIHFNMTSYGEEISGNGSQSEPDGMFMQFRIHMFADSLASLKFDVVINNYTFQSEESILVVAFKLVSTHVQHMHQKNYNVSFGDAFFHSESSANDTNGEFQVGLSNAIENSSPKIYLAYDQFEGLMIHDPTIGINNNAIEISDPVDTSDDTISNTGPETTGSDIDTGFDIRNLSGEVVIASTVLASALFIGIPILIHRKR